MAKDKSIQYRQDGFNFALRYLTSHSIEELERELKYRKLTMIKTSITFEELDDNQGTQIMRDFVFECQDLIWAMALHNFGFGEKRLLRNLERVHKNRPQLLIECYKVSQCNDEILHGYLQSNKYTVTEEDFKKYEPSKQCMDYIKAREDAIEYAVRIVRESGLVGLRNRITTTNYQNKKVEEELTYANCIARAHINESAITEWLISLHDLEGWGNVRLNRIMDEFERLYTLVDNGIFGMQNYYLTILESTGIDMPHEVMQDDATWPAIKVGDAIKIACEKAGVDESELIEQIETARDTEPNRGTETDISTEQPISVTEDCDCGHLQEAGDGEEPTDQRSISEPGEFECFPCPKCESRTECKSIGYRSRCECLALYKEVLRERKRGKSA